MRSVTEELEDWKHLNFPVPDDDKEAGEESTQPEAEAAASAAT
jgi:hypothetical protein